MKLFLIYLLLGLAPNALAWRWTADGDEATAGKSRVVVVSGDEAPVAAGRANAIWTTDAGDGQIVVVTSADIDVADVGSGDPGKVRTVKVVTGAGDVEGAADRGWLGVSIGGVPEALAAQLDLKDRGVLVLNVVAGSPADKGGIQGNDIILSINGQDVAGEVSGAVDAIKSHKPGEKLNVVVLRNGLQKTINVTLGSRAELKENKIEWKLEGSPDAEVEESIKTRGKFIMRGPNGEWVTKDLGDLDQLKNLPDHIRMFIPESGKKSIQLFVESGKKTVKTQAESDGSSVAVEQRDGGEIIVRRTDANGKEAVAKYENEDALKAGDSEAYQLYKEAGESITVHVDSEGGGHSFLLHGDDEDLFDAGGDEWRAKLEESLAEAKDAYRRAMEEFQSAMQQWSGGAPDVLKLGELHEMLRRGDNARPQSLALQYEKPKHTFTVRADGSIEVRIRRGDSELVQEFANESDLSKRRPDLAEKFQDLKSADEE